MKRKNNKATLSMIYGILSLIFSWCCAYINIPCAVAAIILAVVFKKENKNTYCVRSYTGLVCGILALILDIPLFINLIFLKI